MSDEQNLPAPDNAERILKNAESLTPAQRRHARMAAELDRLEKAKADETERKQREKEEAAAEIAAVKEANEPPSLADLGLKVDKEDLRLDDILTDEEVLAVKKKARAQVVKERKREREEELLAAELEAERRKLGTMPADEVYALEMAEQVFVRIELPSMRTPNGRDISPDPIIIDQRVYANGWSGYVSRGLAEFINGLIAAAWQHVAQVEGRVQTYYNSTAGHVIKAHPPAQYDPASGAMTYRGGAAGGGGGVRPVPNSQPGRVS